VSWSRAARVGLDRGVRADVHDRAAGRGQQRERELDQAQLGQHVHPEDDLQVVQRVTGQGRQRARPERAGVVHQQVQGAETGCGLGQFPSVSRVGEIADEGGGARAERGGGGPKGGLAPSVDDQVPVPFGQRRGQGQTEPGRAASDQGDRH
jgi:hypothetical protein